MSKSLLTLHRLPLALLLLLLLTCTALYAAAGEVKALSAVSWMDIAGEGGSAIFAACWLLLILSSRPRGRVTQLLVLGLGGIMLSMWADFMDEIFAIPAEQVWDHWMESLFMPLGMLVLTAGIYFWRQEQLSLSEQMQKRERIFREHRGVDRITQLAPAAYLRGQLTLEHARFPQRQAALVLLDINDFHHINREHGHGEGDRLLQAVSHLLLLNLRNTDLLCRYAGDRFAMLLPDTSESEARRIAEELGAAIAHFSHRSRRDGSRIALSARIAVSQANEPADSLLARLNQSLERMRRPSQPATTPA